MWWDGGGGSTLGRADIGGGTLLYGHVTIQVKGAGNRTGTDSEGQGHPGRVRERGGQGHGRCLPALGVVAAYKPPGGR